MTGNNDSGFVVQHALPAGMTADDYQQRASELRQRLHAESIRLVRLAWSDSHGHARMKMVTASAFIGALSDGYTSSVATFTLDAAGGRLFQSFTPGGGMGLDEMTGSPNIVLAPDLRTFRVLPWAPGVAWILCDEYFPDGQPFFFSARHLLRNQVARLTTRGEVLNVGLEIEWHLSLLPAAADPARPMALGDGQVGAPGRRGKAIRTLPFEPGFSYHSEGVIDRIQPLLSEIEAACADLDLPLRSIENEWGAGQLECTFAPQDALRAADTYFLFRSALRQLCRRAGFHASFMCWPNLPGAYPSGWHLHQSVADLENGENLWSPDYVEEPLAPNGMAWLAGLIDHAAAATVFTTPTVNGYRRFRPNSLAPDRATWSHDHKGVMLRVLGGKGDPATRIENRVGEVAANPYLFVAAQIAAGLDGVERYLVPHAADDDPYNSDRPALPRTLPAALDALAGSDLFAEQFGQRYLDYYLTLKRAEIARFEASGAEHTGETVSAWEQDEYFDTF